MDDEIENLLIKIRADMGDLPKDLSQMGQLVDGQFGDVLGRAGKKLESSLVKALQTGKLGFDDLRSIALSVINDIAASALQSGLASLGLGGDSGLSGILQSGIGALLGLPGRATGGSVNAGRAYMVGENGPEIFMPRASGHIVANHQLGHGASRPVNVTINVQGAGRQSSAEALQRSAHQVARAMRRTLAE